MLAAIIVPPHLSVSGAARAGEELSIALAPYCDITVASMMSGDGARSDSGNSGRASPARLPVRTWLPGFLPWSKIPHKFSTPLYRSDLSDLIRRGRYDLVHLHNPMPALELERAARTCDEMHIPYVVSTHGFNEIANGLEIYGFGRLQKMMWRRLISGPVERVVSKAAAIFALSPADLDIVRMMGYRGTELPIVSNGVPLPNDGKPAEDFPVLERLGVTPERTSGQISCIFLANHTANKGLPVLFEAFLKLERPFLLIVGGERRDGIDYDRFVSACRPGQQIIVTGRVSDAEVAALLRRSDLFVFPTLADTFPLVVLEAMAHALPVLASRVGGIPYQLDERCGVLVSPGKPDELAAAIELLAQNPKRLKEMGRNARARVAAEFTWEGAAKHAIAGYERVLQRHKSLATLKS